MRPPLRGDSAGGEGGLTRGTNDVSSENEYVLDHIFSFGFKNSNALDGIHKHPTAPLPSVHRDMKNPSGPADFTTKEVMAAITSMPRATTGGPSNLTDSLLHTLCVVQPKAHPWHACCPGEGAVITGKRQGSSIDRNFLRCAKLALMKVS